MGAILTKAGKELFAKNLDQYAPVDPLYEEYVDNKGKKKRRKREIPPGLSDRDIKILKSVKWRAHYLDKGFKICGMRFGYTFIIGIIPGIGDVADAFLNYYLVLKKAQKAELPGWLLRQMLINNAISAGAGLIPFVGDIVLASFKANSRNANLLEEFLRIRGAEYLKIVTEGGEAYQVGTQKKKVNGKEIGTTTSKVVAPKGTTKADAEQIKPGAGKKTGEVVVEPAEAAVLASASAPAAATVKASPPPVLSTTTPPKEPTPLVKVTDPTGATSSASSTSNGKAKSGSSSWWKRGNSAKAAAAQQTSGKTKFVEHVNSGSTPGTSGRNSEGGISPPSKEV